MPLIPTRPGAARQTVARLIATGAAAAFAVALAGCSSSGTAIEASASPTATAPPVATVTPTPGVLPSATVVVTASPVPTAVVTPPAVGPDGVVLRFSVPEAGPNFDIHREVSPSVSTWGIGLIYSRLFRNSSDSSLGSVECELCERWELTAAGDLRITLRPDVRWQRITPLDGRALIASDVAFSLERQRAPGAPNGDLLAKVGVITVVDDRTLDLEIDRLDADLFLDLADGRTRVVAPEAVGVNGDLLRGPNVGSGPWVWVATSAQTAAYDRNPDYFEPGRPGVAGLQISFIPSPDTRAAALRTGVLDFADAPPSETARIRQSLPGAIQRTVVSSGAGAEIALNTSVPPFDSVTFRRAVFRAMDPWADLRDVWGGDGRVTLGIPSPDPSWLLSEDALRTAFGDRARALELLAESGVQPGEPVEITVGLFGDEYTAQAARVADALASLGFDSVISEVTTREFAERVWIGGDYEVFVGAQAPVEGVNDDLLSVHHSLGAWNTTGFASAELDALIDVQAGQLDPAERRRTLLDAQFRILEGAHRFTVAARVTNWFGREWLEGFDPDPRRGENGWLARISIVDRPETSIR